MRSRRWIGTALITLAAVAVLAAFGYGAYCYGYARGQQVAGLALPHMQVFGRGEPEFRRGPSLAEGEYPEELRGRFHRFAPGNEKNLWEAHSSFTARALPWSGFFLIFVAATKLLFIAGLFWLAYKLVSLFTGGRNWQLSFRSDDGEAVPTAEPAKGRAKKS